jgi:hypothetical protein
MKILKLLQADVFIKNNIGTSEQRQEMINIAQNVKTAMYEQGMDFSNDGCWRHEFDYENIDWLMEHIRDSVNDAINYYIEQDPSYKNKVDNYQNPEVNYWTNINEINSRNVMHDHRLHHYVAVYYLQGKDTGEITWHNPMNVLESCHPHAPFMSKFSYEPEDGDLLVWPAWMPHETAVNISSQQRINIAFNIRFQTTKHIK